MARSIVNSLKFLWRGIVVPFVRDGSGDIANATGAELVKSNVRTILNTTCASRKTQGEVPWNQNLGCLLKFLRHQNMDDESFKEMATYYVVDALSRNEPRVRVTGVRIIKDRRNFRVTIKVTYNVVDTAAPGLPVIAANQSTEVVL